MRTPEFDLCVIGGGAAGLVVAAGGATLGAKVALVEKHALGGDCLHYGCVPSKTLLASAKAAHIMRSAQRFGLTPHTPDIGLDAVMRRVAGVIKSIEPNDSPERFRGLGVEVIFGAGKFTDANTFEVNDRALTAKKFVIATGSRPALPPLPGLDTIPYLTNETVFSLRDNVASLLVLGAGPIGLELAQGFCRLGSRVSVVDLAPQALPAEDADLAQVIVKQMSQEGVEFYLSATPLRVENHAGGIRLILKDAAGAEKNIVASRLLVATGRRANVENLGLEIAGVAVEKGMAVTDARLRTSNARIYACGDVATPYRFTHIAEHQAGIVLRNALFHLPAKIETRTLPWCTFTDPELARVGLSERDALKQSIAHEIYTFPFDDIDRARTDAEDAGFVKLVADPKGRLLGAAIAGPHAGELIHEYALALKKNLKLADISGLIHVYPTLSLINRRAADARIKAKFSPGAKKWMKRIFGLRGA
ncbi:MAG: dihydrolipoyl dehydrogenase family protein [Burkholderiales bacterium]